MTPTANTSRSTVFAAILLAAGVSFAAPAPPPPGLEPLPEIPAPPGASDADLEPTITIRRSDTEVREEARVNGQLLWIRVTPRNGTASYFLIPDQGGNTYTRRDSLDTSLKVPLWLLYSF